MTSSDAVIFWFRQDLRLGGNPGLAAALATGRPVLPVFVLDEEAPGRWRPGGASRWWLHHSLERLAAELRRRDAQLILRRGAAEEVLDRLVTEHRVGAVYCNRLYEPWAVARDARVATLLQRRGVTLDSHNAALLAEPGEIVTAGGEPYKVFTPFWRALQARKFQATAPTGRMGPLDAAPASDALESWTLLPKPDWADGLRRSWQPGEDGARQRLATFLDEHLADYPGLRDRPDVAATSRLSPHLHWGEIGPRQVWNAVMMRASDEPALAGAAEAFLRQLAWREFSHHLLYHWPGLPDAPWRPEFERFPWRTDPVHLAAWQSGRTGYPIVDAAMRELWQTGWMHNRARMIAASFLVKDLRIPWQLGEAWFWDTLVDADLAQNAANWQWVAGSGADAAPYFRIFNPVTQGEKFDPDGDYIRRFLPELAGLPPQYLHRPWQAPPLILAAAGVELGSSYPLPCVDHTEARDEALAAWRRMRGDPAEDC